MELTECVKKRLDIHLRTVCCQRKRAYDTEGVTVVSDECQQGIRLLGCKMFIRLDGDKVAQVLDGEQHKLVDSLDFQVAASFHPLSGETHLFLEIADVMMPESAVLKLRNEAVKFLSRVGPFFSLCVDDSNFHIVSWLMTQNRPPRYKILRRNARLLHKILCHSLKL